MLRPDSQGFRRFRKPGFFRVPPPYGSAAGILPLEFVSEADYDGIDQGDILAVEDLRDQIEAGDTITVKNLTKGKSFETKCPLSRRMKDILLCGGLLDYTKANLKK